MGGLEPGLITSANNRANNTRRHSRTAQAQSPHAAHGCSRLRACRLKGANCASRADLVRTHITARILACTGAAASSSSSSTRHGRRPIERRQSRANACLQHSCSRRRPRARRAAAAASSARSATAGRSLCASEQGSLVRSRLSRFAHVFAWYTLLRLALVPGSLL